MGHVWGGIFTLLLACACASDLRARRIPNWLVLLLAAAGMTFSAATMSPLQGVSRSLLGFLVGLAIWLPFYLVRIPGLVHLGAGDVKLLAAAGTWLGVAGTVRASFLAALAGALLALCILLWQRSARQVLEALALWLSSVRHSKLVAPIPVSRSSSQLPYGVALAIGAALAAWLPG